MLSDLAFALAGSGHEVQVITSRLTYEGDRILSAAERIQNVTISRVPTTAFGRGKLLGRALDYFTFYLSAGLRLALDAQPCDVVVVKTDPPMLSVVAGPIARLKVLATLTGFRISFQKSRQLVRTRNHRAPAVPVPSEAAFAFRKRVGWTSHPDKPAACADRGGA